MSNILAKPSDMLLRFDKNLLGQLVNDDSQQLTPLELLSDPALQAALDDAAGMILSALYVAYKYTATDILNVSDETASMLRRLACDLAVVYICQRRGYGYEDKFPMVALSVQQIQLLRNGERVLSLGPNEQAGLAVATRASVIQQARAGLVIANYRVFPVRELREGWVSPP